MASKSRKSGGNESISIVLTDVAVALYDLLSACSVIVGVTFLFCVRTSYKAKSAITTTKTRATGQRMIVLKMNGFDILIQCPRGIIGVRSNCAQAEDRVRHSRGSP